MVGHPSNRVLGSDVLAYCILDKKSITKEFFSYKIYSLNNVEEKTINISHILDSYFDEANDLLESLVKISGITVADNVLEDKIAKVLEAFNRNEKYRPHLNEFINEYKNQYKDLTDQHRILWRYNLINKLFKELSNDSYLNEIIEYCIGLEIGKLYKLIFNLSYDIEIKRIIPDGISSLYRFLNKNPKVIPILEYLKDIESPLFRYGLDLLEAEAERKSSMKFKRYIKLIKDAYNNKESDLVYAYTLPIRMYNKK